MEGGGLGKQWGDACMVSVSRCSFLRICLFLIICRCVVHFLDTFLVLITFLLSNLSEVICIGA